MDSRQTANRLLLLVVLSALGLLLVLVPPWVANQIRFVSEAGTPWLYVYLALVGSGTLLLLTMSCTILWRLWQTGRRKQQRRQQRGRDPSQLSRAEQEGELAENLAAVQDLQAELAPAEPLRRELDPLAEKIALKRESQKLEIVAFGAISSGKSSLLNALAGRDVFPTDPKGGTTLHRNEVPWPGRDKVVLVDTPGLGEIDGAERGGLSADAAEDADLVLVVVDGPLRAWELALLARLGAMQKRVLVCLNKGDWFEPSDRERLLQQIRDQVRASVVPQDVVAVRSQATQRSRYRVLADGSQSEESVPVPADIAPLADRMLQIVRRDGRDLLLANLLLQSRGLVEEARQRVQQALDRRAWETVDKYMWGAGSVAALSPLPVLDLVAGCAISTKMVVDLARVYRQDIDLQTVVTLLAQLGKNLLAILGVSAAAPAVTAAVASLLKMVPGIGTIAGGFLQGIVQALVTRWIGGVFIEYFKNEMQQPEGGLASLARREWQRLTTIEELHKLVKAARANLSAEREE
jgi:GTP-binding protein EngB required for normal cell division/uncharacterized protein (DUF697 family)